MFLSFFIFGHLRVSPFPIGGLRCTTQDQSPSSLLLSAVHPGLLQKAGLIRAAQYSVVEILRGVISSLKDMYLMRGDIPSHNSKDSSVLIEQIKVKLFLVYKRNFPSKIGNGSLNLLRTIQSKIGNPVSPLF